MFSCVLIITKQNTYELTKKQKIPVLCKREMNGYSRFTLLGIEENLVNYILIKHSTDILEGIRKKYNEQLIEMITEEDRSKDKMKKKLRRDII